jgi:AcrR family transcriptional regulator
LSELGYDGTSVLLVAKKAGVSRGAAQHQFPSKIDMMMAVASHVVELQTRLRKEMWDSLVADGESLSNIVDFSWSLQSQPESIAMIEIMLASRNDAELHARFQPFMQHITALRKFSASRIAKLIGAEPEDREIVTLVRLHHAAMRGLAIDALVNSDTESLQEAVELLKQYERELIDRINQRINHPSDNEKTDAE